MLGPVPRRGFHPISCTRHSFRAKTPGGSGLEPWLPFWLGVGTFTHRGMWTKLGGEIVNELSLAALGHHECREWLCSGGRWVRVVWGRSV